MEFLKSWYDYFVANAPTSSDLHHGHFDELTDSERKRIGKSIATFQLGEHSEGRGLLRAAQSFERKIGNQYLVRITKLFVAEEQNHAMLLRRFMSIHNIPPIKKHWADVVFRSLRKGVGFELSITVLITAEIIALIYYKALRANTASNQLNRICDKILADEIQHVRYESELIRQIRKRRASLYQPIIRLLHAILFLGTTIVVYSSHRSVVNAGGYRLVEFCVACWTEFSICFQLGRKLIEPGPRSPREARLKYGRSEVTADPTHAQREVDTIVR